MRTNPVTKYWAIALVGTILSLLLFLLVNDKKVQKNTIVIENAISQTELKITDELQKIHLVIASMSFFFENTAIVSQETFQDFTNPFKADLTGIMALEWAPRILESKKSEFYSLGSKQSPKIIKETDDSNDLVQSSTKGLYYPISLINPLQEMKGVLGYDLYSNDIQKSAIKQAISSREMAFTGPIELVADNNGSLGILAMKTVFEPNGFEVKGMVAVVYRMDQFLQSILSSEMTVLDLKINDRTAENALLFNSLSSDFPSNRKAKEIASMATANRIWDISFYPKAAYLQFPHTTESYVVLLMGLLTTLVLISNLKGRDDRSKELEIKVGQRTQELEISNGQKENLLREIHHRVMNNLQITSSLMNLQKRKLQDKEAIYALTSSQDRINAIALIHQKMYQHDGVEAVDLKGYLENLIKSHKRISSNVKYVIDCPEVFIDLDTAVPLAIITSEIVVNALKHAFPKEDKSNLLYILVTPMKNDVIDIVISDNGVGLPSTEDIDKKSGLGRDIIKKLCRQLDAQHEYSSTDSGTAFSLRFKQRKLQVPVFT